MKLFGNNDSGSYRSLKDVYNITSNSTHSNATLSVNKTRSYDFEFAYDVGILALSDEILREHKFDIVNVTLSGMASYSTVRYSTLREIFLFSYYVFLCYKSEHPYLHLIEYLSLILHFGAFFFFFLYYYSFC